MAAIRSPASPSKEAGLLCKDETGCGHRSWVGSEVGEGVNLKRQYPDWSKLACGA